MFLNLAPFESELDKGLN